MRKIKIKHIEPIVVKINNVLIEFYPLNIDNIQKDRYYISKHGLVYDIHNNKIIHTEVHKKYVRCKLYIHKNKRKNFFIHRLVSYTFVYCDGDYEEMTVDHKDGDKLNNYYKNLKWVTRSDNTKLAYKNGLNTQKGVDNNANVYSQAFIEDICKKYSNGYSTKDILNEMQLCKRERGIMRATLNRILRGETWTQISTKYGIVKI